MTENDTHCWVLLAFMSLYVSLILPAELVDGYFGVHIEVYSIQYYVIKFVSDSRQVDGFLWVLRFSPPIKLTARHDITEILLRVALNTISLKLFRSDCTPPQIKKSHIFYSPEFAGRFTPITYKLLLI